MGPTQEQPTQDTRVSNFKIFEPLLSDTAKLFSGLTQDVQAFCVTARLLDLRIPSNANVSTIIAAFRSLTPESRVAALKAIAADSNNPHQIGILLVAGLNDKDSEVALAAARISLDNPDLLSRESSARVPLGSLKSKQWLSELNRVLGGCWIDRLIHKAIDSADRLGTYLDVSLNFASFDAHLALTREPRHRDSMHRDSLHKITHLIALGRIGPETLREIWSAFDVNQKLLILEMVSSSRPRDNSDLLRTSRYKSFLTSGVVWPYDHAGPSDFIVAGLETDSNAVIRAALEVIICDPDLICQTDRPSVFRHCMSKSKIIRSLAFQVICSDETAGLWAKRDLMMYASNSGMDPVSVDVRAQAIEILSMLGFDEREYSPWKPGRKPVARVSIREEDLDDVA